MYKLRIDLEHCYGIKQLKYEFDFDLCQTHIIYASNGVMKTSLAKTFKDLSSGKQPFDQIDASLKSACKLEIDDSGTEIAPGEICVIEPYSDAALKSEDKILTLLANEETRKEYLEIFTEIEKQKIEFIKKLKGLSRSTNCESELLDTFSDSHGENIYQILNGIVDDVARSNDTFDFKYNDIFDKSNKVKMFLNSNFEMLQSYIQRYEELISKSDFFYKNTDVIFGTTEAKNLKDSLKGDEFYKAGHRLLLKSDNTVSGNKELGELVDSEVSKIFDDDALKSIFDKIDKLLDANKELIAFKKAIEQDNSLLLKLAHYEEFRIEVWLSYIKQIESDFYSVVEIYNSKKVEIEKIIEKARSSKSEWDEVIEEFNNRFTVPFKLIITNKEDAILQELTPAIEFQFEGKPIEKNTLVSSVLSQGERRAFYLLNVIFEIRSRKSKEQKTLFIIDDVADSFDYKNKYAIVEYLNDISNDPLFFSLILTHNFDFFRTIQSRVLGSSMKWKHSHIAEKSSKGITINKVAGLNVTDPFKKWRDGMNTDEKLLVACIPFVRNLIEFKDGMCTDYIKLTHLLHDKKASPDGKFKATNDICISDVEPIFASTLAATNFEHKDKSKIIVDIIQNEAEKIRVKTTSDTIALEDKVILSMAIRLLAEKYMWSKVSDTTEIQKNQGGVLFQRFKAEYIGDDKHQEILKTLESVNIMSPENIHLNSFMYEPILDIGLQELVDLYSKVRALKAEPYA